MEKEERITVKVKTMDEAIFDFKILSTDKVEELKKKILDELEVPINRQRIVFMGKLLQNDQTFSHYNVQDGNVLHMIANLEERNEEGNIEEENQEFDEIDEEEPVLHERAEQEILAGIFRTLSDTSLNRRNYRRRMMQRRLAGFNVNSKESLEVIRQNLMTLGQLEKDAVKDHEEIRPISEIKGFNFSERKLEIGQWIDVKDTIDQWLEAEVIDVNESQVYVHYNGWGRRWDEWIDMNSPRIAAFRTHTVQSPYSMYMSPNPCHQLDGDHSNVPVVETKVEETVDETKEKSFKLSEMLEELMKAKMKREELLNKKPKEKSERSPITMRIRNVRSRRRYPKRRRVSKGIGSSEKYNMEKEDRIETQSNFSLKIKESNISNFKDKDDCRSMKSLKMKTTTEADTEKDKDDDSMSSKSFKSQSQMSSNLNFNFPDYISEERSIDEEEYERELEQEKENYELELQKANQELQTRCAQLAPIMERMGRLMIDLAPHVAMMGSNLFPPVTNTISEVSMYTNDGSQISHNRLNDPIQRLLNPPNEPTSIGRRSLSGFTGVGNQVNQNTLSSNGRTLNFEVPVMLNPGELLSVTQRQNNLMGDGNVHLHLNAQVHLPQNESNDYLANNNNNRNRNNNNNRRPETKDVAVQTVREMRPINIKPVSNSQREIEQSPLLKSLNPEGRHFENSPFGRSNLNHILPNFGSLRHTTSEGPKDTEPSEIPSIKKYNKRSGMSTVRDDDLNRELLDNSLHGTIEERDENEEPEMQDISFRDLDFGVDIVENDPEHEMEEVLKKDDYGDDLGEVFLGRQKSDGNVGKLNDNKSVDDKFLKIFNEPSHSENLGSVENNIPDENLSSNLNLSTENKEKLIKDKEALSLKFKEGGSMSSDLR